MRGFQPYQQQMPQQQSSLVSPQTLGLLMQAYKAYQGQGSPAGGSTGATGTDYAGSGMQGTGYGMGQPLVAGGDSGQSAQGYQSLLQAMMQARGMGQ